jgi:2-methylisocitrate lyase-like PEP mutase family enzyme
MSLSPSANASAVQSPTDRLRELLAASGCQRMPCCFDALSARLVEQAGFPLTFMSGFAVSAARAALPDTGLLSVSEMLDQGRSICDAVSIPVIGDGDTGHGNVVNVHRTVAQFARAGFAGVMIEDQLAPKRCGHTGVKEVVERDEAERRIRAAVAARDAGADLVIVARTDARSALESSLGPERALAEAIDRLKSFAGPRRRRPLPGSTADRGGDGPLLRRGARRPYGEYVGGRHHAAPIHSKLAELGYRPRGLSAHAARLRRACHAGGAR